MNFGCLLNKKEISVMNGSAIRSFVFVLPLVDAAMQHLLLHFVVSDVSKHTQLVSNLLFGQLLVLLVHFLYDCLPLFLNFFRWDIHIRLFEFAALVFLSAKTVR